jgi:uncharacterized membrane protein
MRSVWKIIILIMIIASAASIYFYPQMPDQMASHWNAKGEVDDYMSRFWGLAITPLILIAMALLFAAIPIIDPLKRNIKKFRKHFDTFIILIFLFMLAIHLMVIAANLGKPIRFNVLMPIALGILFFYIGNLCKHAKRNWFIGIRTPWTLSSEKVWDKTHKLGAILFKASGIIAIIGAFFGPYALWFVLIPVIATAIITILYSYLEFRKIRKK